MLSPLYPALLAQLGPALPGHKAQGTQGPVVGVTRVLVTEVTLRVTEGCQGRILRPEAFPDDSPWLLPGTLPRSSWLNYTQLAS